MPISGPASYIPTINEFLSHWALANTQPGAPGGGVVLAGGTTQAYLLSQLGGLSAARDAVTDMGVDRAVAREQLRTLVEKLQGRLVEFNGRVRADLAGTAISRSLPAAFSLTDAEGRVRDALRQISRLWTKVNAINPPPPGVPLPLVLMAGYDVGSFDTDRTALRDAYGTLSGADVNLRVAREERNDLQDRIYDVLKNYRAKLPTVFPAGAAILDSLPLLTPAGGHTPDAVTATATWDAPSTKAKITWTESADAEIGRYEVRGCPGDTYVAADETVLATVMPGDPLEFLTDFALSVPGLTAGFKVYVVLTTSNERGSDAVYVTRP